MVAVPYILVNIVLGRLSLILFCITSAALISQSPRTNRYLPPQLRKERTLAFVAQVLVLAVLSVVVVRGWARLRNGFIYSSHIFDVFFYSGLINSVVLTCQFLDARHFLNTPKMQRRLLIGTVSVVMISLSAIVVIAAVVGLFVIR
jgi:hypothetical protein